MAMIAHASTRPAAPSGRLARAAEALIFLGLLAGGAVLTGFASLL